jgi:hypothetical protein
MTTFAATFRDLVMPTLQRHCRTAGFCVERGRWSFTEGHAFVWDMARSRGALHLPLQIIGDLDGWIDVQILKASIEMEDDGVRLAYVDECVNRIMAEHG